MADRPIADGFGTEARLESTTGHLDVNGIYEDVWNATAGSITKGDPLYPTGSITSGKRNIDLAEADATGANVNRRSFYAVAAEDMAPGTGGKAIIRGRLDDVDMSAWSVGDELWLSNTQGQYTTSKPLLDSTQRKAGIVKDNSVSGCLQVDIEDLSWVGAVQSAFQANERSGFVLDSTRKAVDSAGGAMTISVDDTTRTLTLTPPSGAFPIYSADNLFFKTGAQQVVWTDVEGSHFFYFDNLGVFQHTTTFDYRFILGPYVFVAELVWDATNKEVILDNAIRELHGSAMPGPSHLHFHFNIGSQVEGGGLTLGDIISNGNGSLDSHAQFSVASGQITDEDQLLSIGAVASTTGTRVLGIEGSTPVLRQYTKAGFSVLTDNDVTTKAGTSTGRLVYNYFDGADWVYDAVSVNNFVLCHVFAVGTSTTGGGETVYSAVGQAEYSNVTDAREGAASEINTLTQILNFQEIRPIATVIFQTGSYGNAVDARIRPDAEGNDYVDQRAATAIGGTGLTTTDHQSLSGRDTYTAHPANAIQYMAPTTLTISAGAVTYTQPTHIIAAESGTTDDLATISVATSDSYRLAIQADTGDTITIKDGTGNIVTNSGSDFVLSGDKVADMVYDGAQWVVVNISDSGGTTQGTDGNTYNIRATDEGTTAGNARGEYSIDLQTQKGLASQVASGQRSTMMGTSNSTASGAQSIVMGSGSSTASGQYSFCFGANSSTASETYAACIGTDNGLADHYGEKVLHARQNTQSGTVMYYQVTTATSEAELLLNGVGGERLTITANDSYSFKIHIMAAQDDGSTGRWTREGNITNQGGTTSLDGSVLQVGTDYENANIGAPTISITADDTNDALAVKVTPANTTTTRWSAHLEYIKITF